MMQQTISSRGAGRCTTRLAGRRVSAPSLAIRRARSLVVRAQQVPEAEDEAEPTTSYSHAARQAYARLSAPPKVGAEYGEGFMQFRLGGEPRRLDVAALNESLKAGGALRLRFHNRPDEAYGCVFDFDSIIANTHGAYVSAWRKLAEARGLPLPRHARLSMHATAPERIIMDVLGWTSSMKEARALAFELAETYAQELAAGPAMATPLGDRRGRAGEHRAALPVGLPAAEPAAQHVRRVRGQPRGRHGRAQLHHEGGGCACVARLPCLQAAVGGRYGGAAGPPHRVQPEAPVRKQRRGVHGPAHAALRRQAREPAPCGQCPAVRGAVWPVPCCEGRRVASALL
eukprot:XP_001696083.1 haloacid dehalogenase-like hydrolase [Chlamydomonas reinhardtii]